MADPKNTEDQELSLDQLKNTAGGYCGIDLGEVDIPAVRSTKRPAKPVDNLASSASPGGDNV